MIREVLLLCASTILITACVPVTPGGGATPTQIDSIPTPAAPLVTELVPTDELSPTPTQPSTSGQQFIAYVQNGQLLVTDVTNGRKY